MKDKKFIRSGPHLPVYNLHETLNYYRDRLGFYDEWTWADKDGVYAAMKCVCSLQKIRNL